MLLKRGEYCLQTLKSDLWTQTKSKGMFEKFNMVISGIDFARYHSYHSVFIHHIKSGLVNLAVYAYDILQTESDSATLAKTKEYLKHHFVTKDMGKPKYFLGIEVAYQNYGLILTQRKYALDLLEETYFFWCKPVSTPIKVNVDLWCDDSHLLYDSGQYKRLIEKLIYLTITKPRPAITFAVRVLSRSMH